MSPSTTPEGSAATALSLGLPDAVDSWRVYLLVCADSTYYCGVAKHLDRRVAQHNGLQPGCAKYTRTRRPVNLIAFCVCADKQSAYRLEYAVKAAPRRKKLDVLLSSDDK